MGTRYQFLIEAADMYKKNLPKQSLLALLLMFPALSATAETSTAVGDGPGKSSPQTVIKSVSSSKSSLVTWRDLSIDAMDLEASLQFAAEPDRLAFRQDIRRITAMLENILVQRTLAAEAEQSGLAKSPVFDAELRLARERILARLRLQAFEENLQPPDFIAAAEEKYRLSPEDFATKEAVRASHVLVSTEKRSEEEARARAEEVLSKARAGESFSTLVRQYSEDPSAGANGGDLGFFERGKMVKPFEDAAFALKNKGDLSEVVQTQFGFHVIQLQRKRPFKQLTFEEAKPRILAELQRKWVNEQKAAYIAEIKNDKTIKLNEDGINALQIK